MNNRLRSESTSGAPETSTATAQAPGHQTVSTNGGSLLAGAAFFLLSFALLVPGCSTKNSSSDANGPRDSRLVVGTTMHIKRTNLLADYYYNLLARILTHESLVRFDERLNPVPCLATHFECSRDGKTWTFTLAPDAKWHDGKPVTAEDVSFTFQYIAEQNLDSKWISDSIASIDTMADRVVLHLKKPNSRFLVNGGFIVHILPRHIWQPIKDARTADGPEIAVGSGPFILDAFDGPAGYVSFRANRRHRTGPFQLSHADFRIFGNLDVLAMALKKGEVDVFFNYAATFPNPYIEALRQTEHLDFIDADSMGIPALLGFNTRNELTRRLHCRRAIALALDYQRMNRAIMGGKGTIPGPGIIPPPFSFRESYAPWRQDLVEARRLLKEEGFSDNNGDGFLENRKGEKATLSLLARTDLWGDSQLTRLIIHDLAQLGIEVHAQSVDLSTWQTFNRQGRYDLLLFRTTPWGMMMHAGYGSGYFDARTEGSAVCPVRDPNFSALCDEILRETRPGEQENLYRKLQRYYHDTIPAIALCWGKGLYPFSQNWDGFRLNYLEGGLINSLAWRSIRHRAADREKER